MADEEKDFDTEFGELFDATESSSGADQDEQDTTQEVEEEPSEEVEVEEDIPEDNSEDDPEDDLDSEKALQSFKNETGELDVEKLAKSYLHANKLVGEKRVEKERLEQAEKAAQSLQQLEAYIQENPNRQAVMDKFLRGELDAPAPEPQKQTDEPVENQNEKLIKLLQEHKVEEAFQIAVENSPKMRELLDSREADKRSRAQAEEQAEVNRVRAANNAEATELRRKYPEVDQKSKTFDKRLFDELYGVVAAKQNEMAKYSTKAVEWDYEAALDIARARIERSKPKKVSAAQKARAGLGAGVSKSAPPTIEENLLGLKMTKEDWALD